MHRIELLARVPLFSELGLPDLERIAAASYMEEFDADTNIVTLGTPGHSMYIMLEGEVRVLYPGRDDHFELARLGPGELFGEMALLNDMPRSATVRSVGRVSAVVLSKESLRRILLETPGVALKLLEALSLRIRSADNQISGLTDQVIRDTLTGLQNRRAFQERITAECDRARRYGDEFALVLLDIDRFKTINDTFGHQVGDAVLAWFGPVLMEEMRCADTPFRIGGEEFAVLCPGTNAESAGRVATRMVETIRERKPSVHPPMQVTVSVGFACCPDDAATSEKLYQMADQALYRAKRLGRNLACGPEGTSEGLAANA
jgi:diguanylate cyclase (GGDEF)-like protein